MTVTTQHEMGDRVFFLHENIKNMKIQCIMMLREEGKSTQIRYGFHKVDGSTPNAPHYLYIKLEKEVFSTKKELLDLL